MAAQYVGTQSFFICREKRSTPSCFRLGVNTARVTMGSLIQTIRGEWFRYLVMQVGFNQEFRHTNPLTHGKLISVPSVCTVRVQYGKLASALSNVIRCSYTDAQTLEAGWCETRFLLSKLLIHQSPLWRLFNLSCRARFKFERGALQYFNSMKPWRYRFTWKLVLIFILVSKNESTGFRAV